MKVKVLITVLGLMSLTGYGSTKKEKEHAQVECFRNYESNSVDLVRIDHSGTHATYRETLIESFEGSYKTLKCISAAGDYYNLLEKRGYFVTSTISAMF